MYLATRNTARVQESNVPGYKEHGQSTGKQCTWLQGTQEEYKKAMYLATRNTARVQSSPVSQVENLPTRYCIQFSPVSIFQETKRNI